ncbi:MAG: hypothetical protein ACI97A_000758 [Planctomycetota bacterium]|jgi:hypothetical protein
MISFCSCSTTRGEAEPSPALLKASTFLNDGKHKDALAAFSDVAYEGQGDYRAFVGMALCYAHLGDRERFEIFSLEASGRSPFLLPSFYRLGVMYVLAAERFRQRLGSFRYAQLGIEYLRRVFAAKPDYHRDLLPTLGLGLHLAEDHAGGALLLEDTLQRQPNRLDVVHTLLLCYRALNQKEAVQRILFPIQDQEKLPPAWETLWHWSHEK